MNRAQIGIAGAAALLLAVSLPEAFAPGGTTTRGMEPTGTNIGPVQFDAVIELHRYSPRSMRHDRTVIFARYWVARDYYDMAVVWTEPQSTDMFFGACVPGSTLVSTRASFQVAGVPGPTGNETYNKPAGQRPVLRYMFGGYPMAEARFADEAALAARIYAADLEALQDPNHGDGQAFDVSARGDESGVARDVAQVKAHAGGGRIGSLELFDVGQRLLKSIRYEYEDKRTPTRLRRQTITLPERPIMVGFKGEGLKVTLDGKAYRYRDLEAREHAGGRTCTVQYEALTLGGRKASLPVRVTVRGGKDGPILRSVRLSNFQRIDLDAAGAREAARQFAATTKDERRYEQLRLKYREKSPTEIDGEDRNAIDHLRSRFEKGTATIGTSVGRALEHLSALIQLDMILGDQGGLNRHYQRYLGAVAENGPAEMSLVGGYGVIEGAMFAGRRREAGPLLEQWVDTALQTNDAQSVLSFAEAQLARGRLWTTIALLERLAAKCDLDPGLRFEAEALRCAALADLCKLVGAGDVAEKGLMAKAQADWVAPIGQHGLAAMLSAAAAQARRSFGRLTAPTVSQLVLKTRLDEIGEQSDREGDP